MKNVARVYAERVGDRDAKYITLSREGRVDVVEVSLGHGTYATPIEALRDGLRAIGLDLVDVGLAKSSGVSSVGA